MAAIVVAVVVFLFAGEGVAVCSLLVMFIVVFVILGVAQLHMKWEGEGGEGGMLSSDFEQLATADVTRPDPVADRLHNTLYVR